MLITIEIAADPVDGRATRDLRTVTQSAVKLLHVRPDQVHLTVSDTGHTTRARHERWAAITSPKTLWSGC
ncbi:hypothetical protein [Nonomuraea sp. SYSU D8015]|uniref:hypothetical protein n=1 Tax=Nonomuraea sp. SYSU D8015 TaxID=2593644 RepID=UPI0016608F9F|nr:hypothetical protein [Nonomuraea sp. SYSU D8015]